MTRYIPKVIKDNNLHIDLITDFASNSRSTKIFNALEETWKERKDYHHKRRTNITFGDKDRVYEVKGGGYTNKNGEYIKPWHVKRKTVDWNTSSTEACRLVNMMRRRIERITNKKYRYCSVMRYPKFKGIKPHKDKEMHGLICGISVYQYSSGLNTLEMTRKGYPAYSGPAPRSGYPAHSLQLPHGSLYILRGKTNRYWSHCIPEKCDCIRYSLTFRE